MRLFLAIPFVLIAALGGSSLARAEFREGTLSINGRYGQLKVDGDIEDATAPAWGLYFDGIGNQATDFAGGIAFSLGADMMFSKFAYKGDQFPFESEKDLSFYLFGLEVGITAFTSWPVQLQIGLPIANVELSQGEKYRQKYGVENGAIVRLGHLISDGLTFSADFETMTVNQLVDEKETGMTFKSYLATVGWSLKKN